MSVRTSTAILLVVSIAVASFAQEPATPAIARPARTEADPKAVSSYILGPEDQIQIWARDADEISARPYRIDHAGSINLPLVGRVDAVGMTVQEFEYDLELRLQKFLKQPEVTVSVTEFRSSPVFVFGAVRNSGVLQLIGPKTVLEVLSLAGGVTGDAGNTMILTRRMQYGRIPLASSKSDDGEEYSVAEIDLKSLIDGRRADDNLVLRPYDVITVPRSDMIYATGDVRSPGSFQPKDQPLTVLQVVSLAGGVAATAAEQDARIMRPIMGGPKRYDIPVDLKQIIAGKAADFPLQPGDILFVPTGSQTGRKIAARVVEAAINYGMQIAMWGLLWRNN